MIRIYNAKIYDSEKKNFRDGEIFADNGIFTESGSADESFDAHGNFIIPGLVDVHTHGRAGGDFVTADAGMMKKMARSYLESGVTTLLPTLASAPFDRLLEAADIIKSVGNNGTTGADFGGVHLEGRYLNIKKRGAHAPELLAPLDPDELDRLMPRMCGTGLGAVHITAAFELDSDGEFARRALGYGATLGIGHTMAIYKEAMTAVERGVTSFTHTFNAMPQLHHRDGGAVCAGLTGDKYCELICDGFHIAPEMVKLAYMCKKEKLVLITDSMEATGCADGEYSIAGMPVTVSGGKAWTHDGAIAGSTLNLFDGVKNLMSFAGIDFENAIWNATGAPAEMVGIYDRKGSIAPGKDADFLMVSPELKLLGVWQHGVGKVIYE